VIDRSGWLGRLEAEIARELGQAVALVSGGDAPEAQQCDVLEVPGARIVLGADRGDLAGLVVEGRLIDAGQADEATVAELWTGILSSVAARLGGQLGTAASAGHAPAEPCTLRLGNARVRMALSVESEVLPAEIGAAPPAGNYDLLLEVELDAAVRFGSRALELRELLELGPGDVVELDRHLADPVDLIVGDKIVARGEVVLVNGNFGLRVTEVAEPMRRLESIR
jgi:flagellar motor switch protein FliN